MPEELIINYFIDHGLKKSDFVKREAHYKICDACAVVSWQYRNRVDYQSLNKSEGGRFDFINLGLCKRHYQELPGVARMTKAEPIPAIAARPCLHTQTDYLTFNWLSVDDENGNPYNQIEYDGKIWQLIETNSNYMTATYRLVSHD